MSRDASAGAPAFRVNDDFGEWLRPHMGAMLRLACAMVGAADADDVVQDALARAWTKRDAYSPGLGTPRSWLLALTADRARRFRLRAARRRALMGAPDIVSAPDAYVDLDLRRAVSRLSTRQREVVVYFYYADLSVDETALVMGCSTGTVKSTLSDARKRLASLIGAM